MRKRWKGKKGESEEKEEKEKGRMEREMCKVDTKGEGWG